MITAEEIKSLAISEEGYNVDFNVRVPSKIREITLEICAFANSEGGYLLLGIDNHGKIQGLEIDNNTRSKIQDGIRDISPNIQVDLYSVMVDDKKVWVLDVPSGKDKPYVLSGAIYVREGANSQKLTTAEEIRSFFQTCNRIYFDAVLCFRFDVNKELDEDNFQYFRHESNITGNISTNQILNNLQVFDDSGTIKNGGVLFFGKKPEKIFPHAVIHCVLFKGTTKVHIIDDKYYGGTLYNQYKQAEAWIKDKLKVSYIIEDMGPRKEIWEIPLAVFKEAVINALSHRDYYEQEAVTLVEIYDDRVVISNPGGLLLAVKKEFGTRSMSRNPLIFGLFTRMNLVEQVASGIPRMRDEMKEAGLPEPVFTTDGGFFSVEFRRPDDSGTVNGTVKFKTINEEVVFELIKSEEGLSAPEIAERIGKSLRTTKRYLDTLKKSNKIEFRGAPKTGGYYLK
ncbi:MAG: ATP-binding protein [Proteiniphilum sp.]|uniref:ATP-binding protein n=1 Tax=Proteiniphilum sp. TaxID=1926877 RepID=UPI002B216C5D|nr:ATP-binding protein [Proteiniphilum sp.]MEA5126922.1 ATP-binding protein [Proteiniphilum sp.]